MSHRTWTTLASGLLLVAAAGAQDLSGGFGSTLFSPQTTVVADVFAFQPPAVADLNEDGLPDVAVQDIRHTDIALLFGQQGVGLGGKLLVPSGVVSFARVFATDVDGDGHLDLLVSGQVPEMSWVRGHGDGTFDAPLPAGPGPGYMEQLVGDADGDGLADLLIAQIGGLLGFRKGDGGGTFAGPINLGATDAPSDLLLQDLDDDGVLDIALLDFGQVQVLRGLGGGAFAPAQAWSSEAHNGLEAADMDLDGTLDLVHGGNWNVATVLPGLGGLQFGAPKYVSMPPLLQDLTVADLDLDGVPDLLASSSNAQSLLTARRMGPDGPVGPAFASPIGLLHLTDGLQAADFDGDSLPDVLAPNGINMQLGLVLNGLGPFIGLGHELPGPQGAPTLQLFGEPQAGQILSVQVVGPPQPSMGILFAGLQPANIPFAGGLFVPDVLLSVGVPVSGQVYFANFWPVGIPAGTTLYLQAWFKSGSGALSASDAWLIVSE